MPRADQATTDLVTDSFNNNAVSAVLTGPETLEQLTGSQRSLSLTLSAEDLARLDASWLGPGGEALEAYAW